MRVALLVEKLIKDLQEWGVPKPLLQKVQDLYRAAYKEGYAAGQDDYAAMTDDLRQDTDGESTF